MLQGEDMLALSWEVFQAAWAKPGAASMPALAADATLNGGLGKTSPGVPSFQSYPMT